VKWLIVGAISAQASTKRDRYMVEFHTNSPVFVTNFNGFVNMQKDREDGSTRLELDYRMGANARDERMTISSKWRDEASAAQRDVALNG